MRRSVLRLGGWFVLGCLLMALLYQLPAQQTITLGRNDGGYQQNFGEAENRWGVVTDASVPGPFRWVKDESALLLPHLGFPSEVELRWRGQPIDGVLPIVTLILNGEQEIGRWQTTGAWETHRLNLAAISLKPDDFFVLVRTNPSSPPNLSLGSVQMDRVVLRAGWPAWPAPGQVLQGGAALALLAATTRRRRVLLVVAALGVAGWLLAYRYAVGGVLVRHLLRWYVIGGGAGVAWQQAPRLWAWAHSEIAHVAATVIIAAWLAVLGSGARQHTVLAAPGVEKDFRVFATRSEALQCPSQPAADAPCVLRADGFYQLGYPFLLWLVRPFTADNPFLAARWIALASGALLLLSTYLLGSEMLGRAGGLVALLCVAANAFTAEYSLLLGSDMPFAAAWMSGLLFLVQLPRGGWWRWLLAGLGCGAAFLVRHPGILLLPLGWILAGQVHGWRGGRLARPWLKAAGWLTIGWLVAVGPQIVVNLAQTGQPLYSQQAKNIWLAVYGNTDWRNWERATNDVRLGDVVLQEPARFATNWLNNLASTAGLGAGTGGEFGRAWAMRLLGFPANVLAVAGVGWWLWRGSGAARAGHVNGHRMSGSRHGGWLAGGALLYITAVAVGFVLPRLLLPLAGVWAVAAAMLLLVLARRWPGATMTRVAVAASIALALLLLPQPRLGVQAVLGLQDPHAAAMAATLTRTVPPGDHIVARLAADETLAKYSAIAHRFGDAGAWTLWSDRSAKPRPAGRTVATHGPYYLLKNGE